MSSQCLQSKGKGSRFLTEHWYPSCFSLTPIRRSRTAPARSIGSGLQFPHTRVVLSFKAVVLQLHLYSHLHDRVFSVLKAPISK